jgi:hypothetical protein
MMIDWLNLAANGLWIAGLALALAAVSYVSWQSALGQTSLRAGLNAAGAQWVLNFAGGLFCAGLLLTSGSWWEQGLWAVLVLVFLTQVVLLRRRPAPFAKE